MNLRWGIVITIALGALVLLAIQAAAEVEYEDEILDDTDDVYGIYTGVTGSFPAIDIVSVSTRQTGDTLNATLTLMANFKIDGNYSVALGIDGEWEIFLHMLSHGPAFGQSNTRDKEIGIWGNISGDGTEISWDMPIDQIGADHNVTIINAHTDYSISWVPHFWDDASPEADAMPDPGPVHVNVKYEVHKNMKTVYLSIDVDYEGEAYRYLMRKVDTDNDGTATEQEASEYVEWMQDPNGPWRSTSLTQTDAAAVSTSLQLWLYEGDLVGGVDQDGDFQLESILTITFPEPGASPYAFEWNDEFGEGRDLFYWWVDDDSSFEVALPESTDETDYVLKTASVSPDELRFYKWDNTSIEMTGAEMKAYWNDTMLVSSGFTVIVEEEPPEDVGFCDAWLEIMVIAPAFIVYQGWMYRSRRTR